MMHYDGPSIPVPHAPRILITRLSAVGDCIHSIPLAHALRARFPNAFLAWVTQAGPGTLIQDVDAIDQLIIVSKDWMKSLSGFVRVRRQLQELAFDITIDPQSLTKSSTLGWLSGAKYRIGFDRPQGREVSPLLNSVLIQPAHEHVVDRYLDLLAPLGILDPRVSFAMRCRPENHITSFLGQHGIVHKKFAVINPGAGWPSKVWPSERYAEVAFQLGNKFQLPSVVTWAGAGEAEMASEIVRRAEGHAITAPPTTLPELRFLLKQSALFVGSDTGPMHLSVAVETPVVSIFGPTDPRRCGPYGANHVALHAADKSQQKLRSTDNSAMLKVTTADVMMACCNILRTSNSAAA